MSSIINVENKWVESQSHREYPENWNGEGWISVPPELESDITIYAPYCELDIRDGVLIGITPTERPPVPDPEPTMVEKLSALEMNTAETLVDLDYRMSELELFNL